MARLPRDRAARRRRVPRAVKRLVLLRHGQTAWNAERRGQGHLDIPLDEIGQLQAKAVAPWMASYRPVRLVSSDLARAAQTTVLIAETTGLTPTYDARLREYDLGDRTGLTLTEYAERFPAEYDAYREGRFEAVSGGENTAQLLARFRPAIDEVADSLADGETAVVVSHGAALKVALMDLLDWPDEPRPDPQGARQLWLGGRRRRPGRTGRQPLLAARRLQPQRPGPRFRIRPRRWLRFRELSGPRIGRWGCGAAGSAPAWHAGGQGFESPQLHPDTKTPGQRASPGASPMSTGRQRGTSRPCLERPYR